MKYEGRGQKKPNCYWKSKGILVQVHNSELIVPKVWFRLVNTERFRHYEFKSAYEFIALIIHTPNYGLIGFEGTNCIYLIWQISPRSRRSVFLDCVVVLTWYRPLLIVSDETRIRQIEIFGCIIYCLTCLAVDKVERLFQNNFFTNNILMFYS